jgi:cellulose synthase/poly-beta-1,6-N-acetylglucosamine synthase-like glycosyltransferase
MEVIVRLHRYLLDKGREGRAECLPFPLAWTEAPEIWEHLGKQRNRWYRGLWEVLSIHRGMMLRPRYGRIGMFALPYQLLFEALAPLLETAGYLVVPLSFFAGILSLPAMISFVSFALAFNLLLSAGSVYVSIRRMRLEKSSEETVLMDYRGVKTILLLVFSGLLSNLGYRQYLIYWQLKGLKEFLQGRKSWDKFARQGFASEDNA